MSTYKVRSLDVWGHCGSECEEGCPCVKDGVHEDNNCNCSYTINDTFAVGEIEVPDNASDNAILATLDSEGFIHANMCAVDDYGNIVSKDTARPLLQLELEK